MPKLKSPITGRRFPSCTFARVLFSCASVFLVGATFPAQLILPGPQSGTMMGRSLAELGSIDAIGTRAIAAGDPLQQNVKIINALNMTVIRVITGAGPEFGFSVAAIADVDADGVADLVVGDPGDASQTGTVHVYSGATGTVPLFSIVGPVAGARFGHCVAGIGDLPPSTGGGDFVVGSPLNGGGTNSGAIRVFSGATGALLNVITGQMPNERLGWVVAGGSDIDNDQVPDYAAGGSGHSSMGADTGIVRVYSGASHGPLITITGAMASSRFGHALALVGDCNCDGFSDFAVGAPGYPGTGSAQGRVTVFSGAPGNPPIYDEFGSKAGVSLGFAVGRGGDITGDGLPDVVHAEGEQQGGAFSATVLEAHIVQGNSQTALSLYSQPGQIIFPFCVQDLAISEKPPGTPPSGSMPSDIILGGTSYGGTPPCGAAGIPASAVASYTGGSPISIVTQPQSQTVCAGTIVSFSVAATWSGPLGYQWRKDNVGIPGATGPTYSVGPASTALAGAYSVRVTSALTGGTTPCRYIDSLPALLTVNVAPPTILAHPQPVTGCVGLPITLNVTSSGAMTYQWRRNMTPIAGANQPTLTIAQASTTVSGNYDVLVANPCGQVTSGTASVTVLSTVTLELTQPFGSGSLSIRNYCGTPNYLYFTALSFDSANAPQLANGWWHGLHVSLSDLLTQWTSGVPDVFRGTFSQQGSSTNLSLPAGSIPASMGGLTLAGLTSELLPGGFGFQRVSSPAYLVLVP